MALSSLITPLRFVYDRTVDSALPALLPTDVKGTIFDMTAVGGLLTFKVSDGLGGFISRNLQFGSGVIVSDVSGSVKVYLSGAQDRSTEESFTSSQLNGYIQNYGNPSQGFVIQQSGVRFTLFQTTTQTRTETSVEETLQEPEPHTPNTGVLAYTEDINTTNYSVGSQRADRENQGTWIMHQNFETDMTNPFFLYLLTARQMAFTGIGSDWGEERDFPAYLRDESIAIVTRNSGRIRAFTMADANREAKGIYNPPSGDDTKFAPADNTDIAIVDTTNPRFENLLTEIETTLTARETSFETATPHTSGSGVLAYRTITGGAFDISLTADATEAALGNWVIDAAFGSDNEPFFIKSLSTHGNAAGFFLRGIGTDFNTAREWTNRGGINHRLAILTRHNNRLRVLRLTRDGALRQLKGWFLTPDTSQIFDVSLNPDIAIVDTSNTRFANLPAAGGVTPTVTETSVQQAEPHTSGSGVLAYTTGRDLSSTLLIPQSDATEATQGTWIINEAFETGELNKFFAYTISSTEIGFAGLNADWNNSREFPAYLRDDSLAIVTRNNGNIKFFHLNEATRISHGRYQYTSGATKLHLLADTDIAIVDLTNTRFDDLTTSNVATTDFDWIWDGTSGTTTTTTATEKESDYSSPSPHTSASGVLAYRSITGGELNIIGETSGNNEAHFGNWAIAQDFESGGAGPIVLARFRATSSVSSAHIIFNRIGSSSRGDVRPPLRSNFGIVTRHNNVIRFMSVGSGMSRRSNGIYDISDFTKVFPESDNPDIAIIDTTNTRFASLTNGQASTDFDWIWDGTTTTTIEDALSIDFDWIWDGVTSITSVGLAGTDTSALDWIWEGTLTDVSAEDSHLYFLLGYLGQSTGTVNQLKSSLAPGGGSASSRVWSIVGVDLTTKQPLANISADGITAAGSTVGIHGPVAFTQFHNKLIAVLNMSQDGARIVNANYCQILSLGGNVPDVEHTSFKSVLSRGVRSIGGTRSLYNPSNGFIVTGICDVSTTEVVVAVVGGNPDTFGNANSYPVFLVKYAITDFANISRTNFFSSWVPVLARRVAFCSANPTVEIDLNDLRHELGLASRPLAGITSDGSFIYGATNTGFSAWKVSDLTLDNSKGISINKINPDESFRGAASTATRLYTYNRRVGSSANPSPQILSITYAEGGVERATQISPNPTDAATETLSKIEINGVIYSVDANVQADWTETDTQADSFIQNKPTIAQADWDETDTSDASFIQNKPNLDEVGDDNVQPDWLETDTSSDSFIQNKPASTFAYRNRTPLWIHNPNDITQAQLTTFRGQWRDLPNKFYADGDTDTVTKTLSADWRTFHHIQIILRFGAAFTGGERNGMGFQMIQFEPSDRTRMDTNGGNMQVLVGNRNAGFNFLAADSGTKVVMKIGTYTAVYAIYGVS